MDQLAQNGSRTVLSGRLLKNKAGEQMVQRGHSNTRTERQSGSEKISLNDNDHLFFYHSTL